MFPCMLNALVVVIFAFFFIFIKCFDSFLIICMQGGSNKQAGWLAGWIERVMGITYKTDGDWDDVNLYVEPFSELWWKFEMRRSRVVWSVQSSVQICPKMNPRMLCFWHKWFQNYMLLELDTVTQRIIPGWDLQKWHITFDFSFFT